MSGPAHKRAVELIDALNKDAAPPTLPDVPPVLRPCSPADPCEEHARFGGAPPSFEPDATEESADDVYDRGAKDGRAGAIRDVARFLRSIGSPRAASEIERREKRGTW